MSGGTERVLLLGIIVLGAGLRFRMLGAKTIWLDEAFSIWVADHPLPDLLSFVAHVDHHPPLFYLLQHTWQAMVGDSAAAVRILPALLGTATIPLLYAAGKRFAGTWIGVVAALLLAISPFHVRYGQESRMYALMAFLGAAALWFLAVYILGSRPRSRRRKAAMAGLAAAQGLLMLSHNTAAVLFPAALNAGIAAASWWEAVLGRNGVRRHHAMAEAVGHADTEPGETCHWALGEAGFWQGWLAVQAGALLIWLPWAPFFIGQGQTVYQDFWIRPPTGYDVWLAFHNFHLAFPEGWFPGTPWWDFLYWGLALAGLWMLAERGAGAVLLAALFLTPAALELAVSVQRPVFSDRTLIWTTLPYYLLVAAGIVKLAARDRAGFQVREGRAPSPTVVAGIATAAVIGLSAYSLHAYYAGYVKEDWRDAAEYVAAQAGAGDLVIFTAPWVQIPFDYYYPEGATELERRGAPADMFSTGELEPRMGADDLPALRSMLDEREVVWLIYAHEWYSDSDRIVLKELERQFGIPVSLQEFLGVRVYRFAR